MLKSEKGFLRENLIALAIERSLKGLAERRQLVLAVATTTVLVGGVAGLILWQRKEVQRRAWQNLAVAQNQAMFGKIDESIGTLKDLLSRYGSTPARAQAQLLLGNLLMATRKTPEAVKAYEDGLRAPSDEKALRPILLMGLGSAYEDAGETAKAVETYDRFLTEFPDHFLAPRILLALVRVHVLLNDVERARQSYEKLLTLHGDSPWTQRAGTYLGAKKQ